MGIFQNIPTFNYVVPETDEICVYLKDALAIFALPWLFLESTRPSD